MYSLQIFCLRDCIKIRIPGTLYKISLFFFCYCCLNEDRFYGKNLLSYLSRGVYEGREGIYQHTSHLLICISFLCRRHPDIRQPMFIPKPERTPDPSLLSRLENDEKNLKNLLKTLRRLTLLERWVTHTTQRDQQVSHPSLTPPDSLKTVTTTISTSKPSLSQKVHVVVLRTDQDIVSGQLYLPYL